jgi:prophage regulatory protein
MRPHPRNTAGNGSENASVGTTERALQAANLLREALALLVADPLALAELSPRPSDRLLRLPEVQRLTGLRRSALYEQMLRGAFPRSVKTGRRAAGWSEAAVQSWIADRVDGQPLQTPSQEGRAR